ncbi:hypothetical protein PMIN04_003795 [Paraphaeosphaeria minitans]
MLPHQLSHQLSREENLAESLDQSSATRDVFSAVSPSPHYSTDCIPSLSYQFSDLPVLGLNSHVVDYSNMVDTRILDTDSPWTPLGVTAFEDMDRLSLSTFDPLGDWEPHFTMPGLTDHPNRDLNFSPTLFKAVPPSTSSIHTEPFYPASAPTPHRGWDSLTPQPYSLDFSDNTSQAFNFSVGDEMYSVSSRSLMPETIPEMPRRSETWSASTGKPARIRCQEGDCNKDFTLRKDLKRHIRAIHDRKTWECEYPDCSRASRGFSRKDKLVSHMRTHSEARRSGSQTEYSKHRVSTTTDAPTKDYTARDYDTTPHKIHIRSDLQEEDDRSSRYRESKSYICTASGCGRYFIKQHDLARHERTMHTEQNPRSGYRCTFKDCSKRDKIFNRLDNFKIHLREQHKLDDVQPFVERSSRMNAESHVNAPFDVTTPEAFSKKMQLG